MKIMKLPLFIGMILFQFVFAQEPFNLENVKLVQGNVTTGLKTNQIVLAWKDAQDPTAKANNFTLMLQEIAGPILARQWNYPGGGEWPLVNWSKVSSLSNFVNDQRNVLETTHAIAQSDEELAKICVLGEVIVGSGGDAELWYENWLLTLAKSSNNNLKRLVFFMTSGFAENLGKSGPSEDIRPINWNDWESSYNQSDNLGKALLLICMTDLASRSEEYAKVTAIHIGVFNGTNDDLKAIAIYSGIRKLGPEVVGKWQDIADNHPNAKLKLLAQELLAQ